MSRFWSLPFHLSTLHLQRFALARSPVITQVHPECILQLLSFRDVPYLESNIKFKKPMFRLEYAECFGVAALTVALGAGLDRVAA